jgi:hypothetical protein
MRRDVSPLRDIARGHETRKTLGFIEETVATFGFDCLARCRGRADQLQARRVTHEAHAMAANMHHGVTSKISCVSDVGDWRD